MFDERNVDVLAVSQTKFKGVEWLENVQGVKQDL